jgi:hypothetical protein
VTKVHTTESDAQGIEYDSSDLCRSVNEGIREQEGLRIGEYDFICECEDDACTQVMRMRAPEYEDARSDPRRFAVLPGHEHPPFERVLRRTDRYALVQKRWGA